MHIGVNRPGRSKIEFYWEQVKNLRFKFGFEAMLNFPLLR